MMKPTEQTKKIKELYILGYKQINIAKVFGLSRQRIHQITHNYQTKHNDYYKNYSKCTCELCNLKFELLHLHHKDGNTQNNEEDNLMYLCPKCHGIIHRMKTWTKKYDKCQKCETTKINHAGFGLCRVCYNIIILKKRRKEKIKTF